MFFTHQKEKKVKKFTNKTKPSSEDVLKAKEDNIDLADKWHAYSREARIHIFTSDINEMSRFYNQILEFPVVKKFRYGNSIGVMINIGGNIVELFNKATDYYDKNFKGNVSFSLRVKDINKLHNKFLKKNIKIGELTKNEWGDTSFTVYDPDGNRIVFFSLDLNYNKYYKVSYN